METVEAVEKRQLLDRLAEAQRDGDRAAGDLLYALCWPHYYGVACRYGKTSEERSDLSMNAAIFALILVGTYDADKGAWLTYALSGIDQELRKLLAKRASDGYYAQDVVVSRSEQHK